MPLPMLKSKIPHAPDPSLSWSALRHRRAHPRSSRVTAGGQVHGTTAHAGTSIIPKDFCEWRRDGGGGISEAEQSR